jgi:hypothetical protein
MNIHSLNINCCAEEHSPDYKEKYQQRLNQHKDVLKDLSEPDLAREIQFA